MSLNERIRSQSRPTSPQYLKLIAVNEETVIRASSEGPRPDSQLPAAPSPRSSLSWLAEGFGFASAALHPLPEATEESILAVAASASEASSSRKGNWFRRLKTRFDRWRAERRNRRELDNVVTSITELNDYILRDNGIERSQIESRILDRSRRNPI